MWNFIIDKIEQWKTQKSGFTKISQLKEEFLENMRNGFRNMTNLTEEGKEMAALIEKGIHNNCFSCEFADRDCGNCPLLGSNGGKLTENCTDPYSTYSVFIICVSGCKWDAAIVLAKEIRDSWRDVE